jgi:hypothetical protein
MMSDERFFNQVKATMVAYSPEVPAAVYGGMRRKLWWSNFTRFSASRLNVWYLALAVGAGTVAATHFYNSESVAAKPGQFKIQQEWSPIASGNVGSAETTSTAVSTCTASCGSMKSKACSASAQTSAAITSKVDASQNVESTSGIDSATDASSQTAAGDQNIAQKTDEATQPDVLEMNDVVTSQDTPAEGKSSKRKTLPVSVYKDKDAQAAEKK